MERNPSDDLTVSTVAAAAGVGIRTLQEGFRRQLDTTPMAHLRRIRMERAHQDLLDADPTDGTTVASIAHSWGFGNLGRFSLAYRERYGRVPSRTLRH